LHPALQASDLSLVQKQLAGTSRLVPKVAGRIVWSNVNVPQPDLTIVIDSSITVAQIDPSSADRLDLRADKD
jgi:hypothetical protein